MTFAARLFSTPRYHHLPQMICCCSEALPLVLLTNAQDFQLLEVVWSVKKVVSKEGRRKGGEKRNHIIKEKKKKKIKEERIAVILQTNAYGYRRRRKEIYIILRSLKLEMSEKYKEAVKRFSTIWRWLSVGSSKLFRGIKLDLFAFLSIERSGLREPLKLSPLLIFMTDSGEEQRRRTFWLNLLCVFWRHYIKFLTLGNFKKQMNKSSKRELEDDSLFIGTLIGKFMALCLCFICWFFYLFPFPLPFALLPLHLLRRYKKTQICARVWGWRYWVWFWVWGWYERWSRRFTSFSVLSSIQFLCFSPTRASHSVSEQFLCFSSLLHVALWSHCSFPSMPRSKGSNTILWKLQGDSPRWYWLLLCSSTSELEYVESEMFTFFPLHHRWKQILIPSCVGNRLGEFFYCRIFLSFSLLPWIRVNCLSLFTTTRKHTLSSLSLSFPPSLISFPPGLESNKKQW